VDQTVRGDTSGDGIDLSIVVPAGDQGRSLMTTLDAAAGARRGLSSSVSEIIVVQDGDRLETARAVASFARDHPGTFLLRNPGSLGCGYSARHGVLLSRGERILLASPGIAFGEEQLREMARLLSEGNDLVVASTGPNGTRPLPPVKIRKELLARSVQTTLRLLSRQRVLRTCRFLHLYRRRAAFEIYRRQRLDDASFVLEVLYLARRFRYSVFEVAHRDLEGTDLQTTDMTGSPAGIGQLVRIRMNRLRGDYG